MAQAIGPEAFRKLQQKALTGVVVRTENRILQFRADISIIPGSGPGQSVAAK